MTCCLPALFVDPLHTLEFTSTYHRLMQMSEIEREQEISARLEERQRLEDKRMISRMVKEQQGGEHDSVARAAKRPSSPIYPSMEYTITYTIGQHTARGATKEKTRKLDELKAKRKAKDEKHRVWLKFAKAAISCSL